MSLIILLAFSKFDTSHSFYSTLIISGLVFGLVGDTFLMFPDNYFMRGLISFLIGHIIYSFAFYFYVDTHNLLIIILIPAVLILIITRVVKSIGKLKYPVLFYSSVLVLMLALAVNVFIIEMNYWILLGAILFFISDLVLAYNKFIRQIKFAHLYILSTYFCAQTLIALSV